MKDAMIFKFTAAAAMVTAAAVLSYNGIYGGLCMGFMIYVAVSEVGISRSENRQYRFLTEFDRFLGSLRHYYLKSYSVRDAMYFGMEKTKGELKKELEEILDIIESDNPDTQGSVYQNSSKDRYLRLLLMMMLLVAENGDEKDESGSVFINALIQLRMEVRDERRDLGIRRHKFMGLSLTAALPSVAVPFIARWGVRTNPDLLMFYYGRTGSIARAIILMVSFLCYNAVRGLKAAEDHAFDFSGTVGIKAKRALLFMVSGSVMLISLVFAHKEAVYLLKNDVSNVERLCDMADGRQIAAMEYFIPEYTQRIIGKIIDLPARDELKDMLLSEMGIRTEEVAYSSADEILRRVAAIETEEVDLLDMLIVLTAGLAGAFYPGLTKIFRSMTEEDRKIEEIMRLQTIISMQKDVPGMSPAMLLESLECFAKYYKNYFERCLNDFGINEQEALLLLKEDEKEHELERIADCFLLADELGVGEAFDEIASEIRTFREDRKADKSIRIDNDVLLASLLAVIPGGLILFGYLLIPFMVSSLNMFNMYQNSLKNYISIT